MYYLKLDKNGICTIYDREPAEPYLAVEELPPPINVRSGYTQKLVTDLNTVWREYEKNPTEIGLDKKLNDLEQVVADLASLQLEVLMNG